MAEQELNLTNFRQKLIDHFSESELNDLVFDLGFDYELLTGKHKGEKARSLIEHFQRRNQLPELVEACKQVRPNISWPNFVLQYSGTSFTSTSTNDVANPFHIGGRINDPEHFFGRKRLIRETRNELKKRTSVSIVGESQIGKSSVLYYLYATRTEWIPKTKVIYLDLQRVLDEADFCEEVLSHFGQKGDTLRDLKRTLFQQDVILLLDEVERIAESDFSPRLHDLLRALAQEPQFAMCLATQRSLIEVFPSHIPGTVSPFHNIFNPKQLGPFTETEVREFLLSRLKGKSIRFTDENIDYLISNSKGHPGKLQLLAKTLFEKYLY